MAKKVRKGSAHASLKKELKQLRLEHAGKHKELINLIGKQEQRVHQVESKFDGVLGFHKGLVKAIGVAMEKVDVRFHTAKRAFAYIFPIIWRLEDFMGTKRITCPSIFRDPFPDDLCAEPISEFR